MSNLLIKETALGVEKIFPKNYILNLVDKESGKTLLLILNSFNMLFLNYIGNKADTRKQVPTMLRKLGLWITYVVGKTTVTEWYNSQAIDDTTWGASTYWVQGSNMLVGDVAISANGTWVINGLDTGISPKGDKGETPLIRVKDNLLLVSYDNGTTYNNLTNTPVYTKFRFNSLTNTYLVSYDLGGTWQDISDEKVYHKFRYNNTTNTYLESIDFGKTWSNISAEKVYYLFRYNAETNTHLVSTDLGLNWTDVSSNKVYYQFRTNDNRLLVSTDLGTTWENCSEPIAAWFRWADTSGTGNVGKVLISRDNKTWSDLSPTITNNLYIKSYVSTVGDLPSNAAIGDIYMVGPTYDESDTTHDYPHYRMWVKLSSGWVDNGEYYNNTRIVLEFGNNSDAVISLLSLTNSILKVLYKEENLVLLGDRPYVLSSSIINLLLYTTVLLTTSSEIKKSYAVSIYIFYTDDTYDYTYMGFCKKVAKVTRNLNKLVSSILVRNSLTSETQNTFTVELINDNSILASIPSKQFILALQLDIYDIRDEADIMINPGESFTIENLDININYYLEASVSDITVPFLVELTCYFKTGTYLILTPTKNDPVATILPLNITKIVAYTSSDIEKPFNLKVKLSNSSSLFVNDKLLYGSLKFLNFYYKPSIIPDSLFIRDKYEIPVGNYNYNLVNTELFINAINSLTSNSRIFLSLTEDIKIKNSLNIISGASVVINCNGYSIYEYHEDSFLAIKDIVDGICRYNYNDIFNLRDTFITEDGELLLLSYSDIYKSVNFNYTDDTSLGNQYKGIAKITLPKELHNLVILELDNVYIKIRTNFIDCTGIVTDISNGILTCKVLINSLISYDYTTLPYFFFINLDNKNTGITIKDNYLYTTINTKLSKCTLLYLIQVENGAFLEINNISNISGSTQNIILNKGTIVLNNNSFNGHFNTVLRTFKNSHSFIKNCNFSNYNSNIVEDLYSKSYIDITFCKFTNIGLYSLNVFAILASNSHAYIADNYFENINYGAICCGNNDSLTSLDNTGYRLVERNKIINTRNFNSLKNRFGLFDGGAIYVGTNNKETTIRYNTILRFGGITGNFGIYLDDGAYNVKVYGNVISGINKVYSITSRYLSSWEEHGRVIPEGCNYNTNNLIAYNIVDAPLLMEANSSIETPNCIFYNNIRINNNYSDKKDSIKPYSNDAIIYDKIGSIDSSGEVKSFNNYSVITSLL